MSTLTTSLLPPPSNLKQQSHGAPLILHRRKFRRNQSQIPVARLFGPAIFESSKLKVLFLGTDEKKHPAHLPRTYTLTHSDVTSKLTLAISQTINNSQFQGWYSKLQRDEVVAEWKKVKGDMSLHVHCHISGGHVLLDLFAKLRFYIFYKELPVVLKAFVHGDGSLFNYYPELQEAQVWVYFHSNMPEFNKVECWGALIDAAPPSPLYGPIDERKANPTTTRHCNVPTQPCPGHCACCFPSMSLIPWSSHKHLPTHPDADSQSLQQQS